AVGVETQAAAARGGLLLAGRLAERGADLFVLCIDGVAGRGERGKAHQDEECDECSLSIHGHFAPFLTMVTVQPLPHDPFWQRMELVPAGEMAHIPDLCLATQPPHILSTPHTPS